VEPAAEPTRQPWVILGSHLHFIGKPTLCLGHVHLRNQSPEELRIKRIPFAAPKLTGPADVPVSHVQVSARLLPGVSLQAPSRLLIPPQTPPGRYTAEVLAGNVRKPVTVDVLESWDLAIIPRGFSLKLHAGERPVCTVQLTNRGNMPWDLRRAALAPLDEKDGINRNVFQSLKNAHGAGYETVLNDFVKRLQESEVGPAKIKILCEADVLEPGETQELKLEISLPDNLRKNRHYSGEISFENARLALDMEVLENPASANKR